MENINQSNEVAAPATNRGAEQVAIIDHGKVTEVTRGCVFPYFSELATPPFVYMEIPHSG
jgi:hypothetical protein